MSDWGAQKPLTDASPTTPNSLAAGLVLQEQGRGCGVLFPHDRR